MAGPSNVDSSEDSAVRGGKADGSLPPRPGHTLHPAGADVKRAERNLCVGARGTEKGDKSLLPIKRFFPENITDLYFCVYHQNLVCLTRCLKVQELGSEIWSAGFAPPLKESM